MVRKRYQLYRTLVKIRIVEKWFIMKSNNILDHLLKQARPSFVGRDDILGPPPRDVFKYPWFQFLSNDAPGLGELGKDMWKHEWYMTSQLVPNAGIRILESWDSEWRNIWNHLDIVSI